MKTNLIWCQIYDDYDDDDKDDDDDDNDDDDDDNDDEDDYSRFRVFGHNSPKNNFLGLKPKNELFLCKNITFLLNNFFQGWSLNFDFWFWWWWWRWI